jgi:hypothetical protein
MIGHALVPLKQLILFSLTPRLTSAKIGTRDITIDASEQLTVMYRIEFEKMYVHLKKITISASPAR